MTPSAVITGLGSICSLGVGKDALYAGLQDGATHFASRKFPGVEQVPALPPLFAASIGQVPAESILGKKGLRSINRESKVFLCAAALAARDAGIEFSEIDPPHIEPRRLNWSASESTIAEMVSRSSPVMRGASSRVTSCKAQMSKWSPPRMLALFP